MSGYSFRAAIVLAGLSVLPGIAEAVQAPAIADAPINQATPTVNAGAAVSLAVASGATTLVRFDLSALPGGTNSTQVAKATAFFWVNAVTTPGAVEVFSVTDPWGEKTVTFATSPYWTPSPLVRMPVAGAGQYLAIDVTAEVKLWVDYPTSNYGIALMPALNAGTTSIALDSKENTTTSHPAFLEITLAGGPRV